MQTVAVTARALALSVLLDPRLLATLAVSVALIAGLLLGAGDASAAPGLPGGGGHRP